MCEITEEWVKNTGEIPRKAAPSTTVQKSSSRQSVRLNARELMPATWMDEWEVWQELRSGGEHLKRLQGVNSEEFTLRCKGNICYIIFIE